MWRKVLTGATWGSPCWRRPWTPLTKLCAKHPLPTRWTVAVVSVCPSICLSGLSVSVCLSVCLLLVPISLLAFMYHWIYIYLYLPSVCCIFLFFGFIIISICWLQSMKERLQEQRDAVHDILREAKQATRASSSTLLSSSSSSSSSCSGTPSSASHSSLFTPPTPATGKRKMKVLVHVQ